MGVLSFHLPKATPPDVLAGLTTAHLAGGYDLAPIPSEVRVVDGVLSFTPAEFESGFVTVPWPVTGFGTMLTSSATLRSRPDPYRLLVELARGKLNQVRNQTTEWVDVGLQPGPGFADKLTAVLKRFGPAVVAGDDPAADALVADVLADAFHLADRLTRTYTDQVFSTRHQHSPRLDTDLGCRLSAVPDPAGTEVFLAAF